MKKIFTILLVMLCVTSCGSDDEPTPKQEPDSVVKPEVVSDFAMPDVNEAVDLGLSVLWSTCNFGAKTVGGHGGYFAWGDPTGKLYSGDGIDFSATTNSYSSWNTTNYGGKNPPENISGTALDVVTKHWGNGWRIPTLAEMYELRTKCQWSLVVNYSINRYQVTGPNGNSIIFPLSGMQGDTPTSSERFSSGPFLVNSICYYWTSNTASTKVSGRGYNVAENIVTSYAFVMNSNNGLSGFVDHLRAYHMAIRPVHDK